MKSVGEQRLDLSLLNREERNAILIVIGGLTLRGLARPLKLLLLNALLDHVVCACDVGGGARDGHYPVTCAGGIHPLLGDLNVGARELLDLHDAFATRAKDSANDVLWDLNVLLGGAVALVLRRAVHARAQAKRILIHVDRRHSRGAVRGLGKGSGGGSIVGSGSSEGVVEHGASAVALSLCYTGRGAAEKAG